MRSALSPPPGRRQAGAGRRRSFRVLPGRPGARRPRRARRGAPGRASLRPPRGKRWRARVALVFSGALRRRRVLARSALSRRCVGARQAEPGPLGRAQRRLAERQLPRRRRRLAAGARQIRHLVPDHEEAETFGNLTGGSPGLRGQRRHDVSGAARYEARVRHSGRHPEHSGLSHLGRRPHPIQSHDHPDDKRPRGNPVAQAVGALYQQNFGDRFDVKIGEQSLDNEWMMSQNAGIFLNAAMGWPALPSESAGRRPRLPALRPRRTRPLAPDRPGDDHGRRLQRQPDPRQFAEHPAQQSKWSELPSQHRPAGDRRAAIYVSPAAPPASPRRTTHCPARTRSAPGTTARISTTSRSTSSACRWRRPKASGSQR